MKTRVENPEIKPQIEAFVIETLENCKLFVDTYGHGFAAKRLATNFKTVFTEELNKKARGQYSLGTSGIMTLFMEGTNGNLLTFEDLKDKDDLQTVLHEAVHAIFNKTPKECKEAKVSLGSGIHEIYQNTELGRGLNEGFTNWVCDKAGLKTMSYPTLTNLVNILEMALGPEKVMQFGKGNISKNISRLLGMTPTDCQTFLSYADQIYNYEDKASDFSLFASTIRRKTSFEAEKIQNPELTMSEELQQDLQSLYNNKLYRNLLNNSDYIKFVQENNLKPELEASKLSYFEHQKDFYFKRAKEIDEEIKGDIFSRYFIEEIKDTIERGDCPAEKYMRFAQLSALIYKYGDFKNETLKNFKEHYEILRKQFFDKAENDIKESLSNGTLTAEKIAEYRDVVVNGNQFDPGDFNSMLSKIMLPENHYVYENLFRTLSANNMAENLFDYKIFELRNPDGQRTNLFFDFKNGNHFTRHINKQKIISANSEIKDKNSLFDMTLNGLQSMQEIVNNFLVLKDEISQKNPNTKLQIVDDIIVSTLDGEKPTFYMLDGNNWTQADVVELIPENAKQNKVSSLQVNSIDTTAIDETEKDRNALETISKNPFKRFFQELKRRFFEPKLTFAVADTNVLQAKNKIEETNKLENSLRFTEDGKPIQTPTIDRNSASINTKKTIEPDKDFIE